MPVYHWPAAGDAVIGTLHTALPAPCAHRIHFDDGAETRDAGCAPNQTRVDQVMRARGYTEGADWVTRTFQGAEHAEASCRARVHIPLQSLLGGRGNAVETESPRPRPRGGARSWPLVP
jgi:hypothetical protein